MDKGQRPARAAAEKATAAEGGRLLSVQRVYADYEVRGALLGPTDQGRSEACQYSPLDTPGIVGDVARLQAGNERQAIAFAKRWGLLGYADILRHLGTRRLIPWGDPLDWIWAHAEGIRAALNLRRLLVSDNAERILEYVDRWRVSDQGTEAWLKTRFPWLRSRVDLPPLPGDLPFSRIPEGSIALPHGRRQKIACEMWQLEPDEDPRLVAWRILLSIINANLLGVYRQLRERSLPPFVRVAHSFDSLVSVVYWHLADLVAGGRVQECVECGTPFGQSDKRQQYCPPAPGSKESLCAMRFRQRKRRRISDKRSTKRKEA